MARTFLVLPGRTLTLPQGLYAGPGATNMRLPPGAVVTLDDDAITSHSRFVNGRIRAEDWKEIDAKDAPVTAPAAISVPDPNKSTGGIAELTTGAVPKKER